MSTTSWPAGPALHSLVDIATDFWHEFRIPLLLALFGGLVALRIYLYATDQGDSRREGLLVFPKVYGAAEEEPSRGESRALAADKKEKPLAAPLPAEAKHAARPALASTAAKATAASAVLPATRKKTAAGPRRIKGDVSKQAAAKLPQQIQPLVFFSSLTGATAKRVQDYVQQLGAVLQEGAADGDDSSSSSSSSSSKTVFCAPQALDLAEVDLDDFFISPPSREKLAAHGVRVGSGSSCDDNDGPVDLFYLFLVPSYNIDSINDTFLEHLQETHHDFRIDTAPLAPILGYSVFGFGDREGWPTEAEGFCFQAKEIDKWMSRLSGRKRAFPVGSGDAKTDAQQRLAEWSEGVVDVLRLLARTGSLGEGVPGAGDAVESDEEEEEGEDGEEEEADEGEVDGGETEAAARVKRKTGVIDDVERKKMGVIDDVEDLGKLLRDAKPETIAAPAAPIAVDFTAYGADSGRRRTPTTAAAAAAKATAPAPKEMVPVNSPTYKSLTKQGYAIVGSHSGVKICRWTKSALRGRGSCYKFSFYGIHSHQCMEATPSLSCSNKCVFCWRHGTNPVGTTWRWVVDAPELIFAGVQRNHYQKIKALRGVPGVRAERYAEAMRIRHCALSLVGEPIFYPHINALLGLLHGQAISSFLVCNAQHPDQLASLHHVTQLYVSIDATNREALRRIDRPLHRDFWERFQRCLAILRDQRFRQRTVFRLTLVKGFNLEDEVRGYADLVAQALPCFIEIKGVTYCGTATSAGVGLTMANVPFYHEVCAFVVALERELQDRGLGYGLAAEHAHSCCVLMASDRFRDPADGRYRTLIDYDRFFALLRQHGPDGAFGPEDYMGEHTPEWAVWGRGGFDPRDQRVDRKGRPIEA